MSGPDRAAPRPAASANGPGARPLGLQARGGGGNAAALAAVNAGRGGGGAPALGGLAAGPAGSGVAGRGPSPARQAGGPPGAPAPARAARAPASVGDAGKAAGSADLSQGAQALGQGSAPIDTQAADGRQKPKIDEKDINDRATRLFDAMDCWGTDEDAVMAALRGLGPEETAALKAAWNVKYGEAGSGRTLDQWLEDELSGEAKSEATAHLSGNKAQATIASLSNSVDWYGDDEAAIEAQLRSLSSKDLADLKALAATDPKAQKVLDRMKSSLGGSDSAVSDALLDPSLSDTQRDAKADAARIFAAIEGAGTDEQAVFAKLEGKSNEERELILAYYKDYSEKSEAQAVAAYEAMHGQGSGGFIKKQDHTLNAAIEGDFSGAQKDLAMALSTGNTLEAQAAKLEIASDRGLFGLGTDEKAILETLKNPALKAPNPTDPKYATDPSMLKKDQAAFERALADREALNKLYASKYGRSIDEMLVAETDDFELELTRQYLAGGKGDPELMIRYAVDGIGTNEEMIKDALADLPKDQIAKIKTDYQARYKSDMLTDLGVGDGYGMFKGFGSELSGKDQIDVELMLEGKPESAADYKKLADMQADFQDSASSRIATTLMGSESYEQFTYEKGKVDGLADLALKNPHDPKVQELLKQHYQFLGDKFESVEKAKNKTADAASMAIMVVAFVATAGTSAPAIAALIAGLAGSATIASNALIKGSSYGWEDTAADGANMAVEVATAGLADTKMAKGWGTMADGIDNKYVRLFVRNQIKNLPGQVASALVKCGIDEEAWSNDHVLDDIVKQLGQDFVLNAIQPYLKAGLDYGRAEYSGYDGKFGAGEWVQRYGQGKEFDMKTRRWQGSN